MVDFVLNRRLSKKIFHWFESQVVPCVLSVLPLPVQQGLSWSPGGSESTGQLPASPGDWVEVFPWREGLGVGFSVGFLGFLYHRVTSVDETQADHKVGYEFPAINHWISESDAADSETILEIAIEVFAQLSSRADQNQLPEVVLRWCQQFRSAQPSDRVDVLEWFLETVDRGARKQLRYYATPNSVATYMLGQVDQSLRDHFHLPEGIFDLESRASVLNRRGARMDPKDEPSPDANPLDPSFVQLLDPSAGSCVFARQWLRLGHDYWARQSKEEQGDWSCFVDERLLSRLLCIDIDPLALWVGRIFFAFDLQRTGYVFGKEKAFNYVLADALSYPFQGFCASIVMGNPPYAALTSTSNSWIHRLLEGEVDGVSYREVENQRLSLQKSWLHDDYVKFFRLGHYLIQKSDLGILSLVTNRGFIDNVGFRAMRWQLQQSFDQVLVVDLQMPARSEVSRVDDQPLFNIGQGVAIAQLSRSLSPKVDANRSLGHEPGVSPAVCYRRLSGPVVQKNEYLNSETATCKSSAHFSAMFFDPETPTYSWVPAAGLVEVRKIYEAGLPLDQLFQKGWSSIVTARDRIVVDSQRGLLEERLVALADAHVSTDQLRERWFARTRSTRYQSGDTRGWRLQEARELLQQDSAWRDRIRPCLYRALDYQWIFDDSRWIDWPRQECVDALHLPGNLALVARKASPAVQRYRFFAVSRCPVIDGALRSDNRGNETIFCLYDQNGQSLLQPMWASKLAEFYGKTYSKLLGIAHGESQGGADVWAIESTAILDSFDAGRLSAEAIVSMIFFVVSQTDYQETFVDFLPEGYPRIFFPGNTLQARHWIKQGQRRIAIELRMQAWANSRQPSDCLAPDVTATYEVEGDKVEGGLWEGPDRLVSVKFPQFDESGQRVLINSTSGFSKIRPEIWSFQQGTHQVLEKYLKGRRKRSLGAHELAYVVGLVRTIGRILDWEKRHRWSRDVFAWRKEVAGIDDVAKIGKPRGIDQWPGLPG